MSLRSKRAGSVLVGFAGSNCRADVGSNHSVAKAGSATSGANTRGTGLAVSSAVFCLTFQDMAPMILAV